MAAEVEGSLITLYDTNPTLGAVDLALNQSQNMVSPNIENSDR